MVALYIQTLRLCSKRNAIHFSSMKFCGQGVSVRGPDRDRLIWQSEVLFEVMTITDTTTRACPRHVLDPEK